jgi:hypothetical protein
MARLRDLAKMIRSKNAGPFELTFDILFDDEAKYLRVKNSGVISRELIARLFGFEVDKVKLFNYDPAFAIKATVPRWTVSGDPDDLAAPD